jgi:hypothetical protein
MRRTNARRRGPSYCRNHLHQHELEEELNDGTHQRPSLELFCCCRKHLHQREFQEKSDPMVSTARYMQLQR